MSDLHIGGGGHGDDVSASGGWMAADANRTPTGQDLIGGLRRIIRETPLAADLLLCPGDLTDKAHPAGLIRAWELVQHMRVELGAELVVAATGNHDTDSRQIIHPGAPFKTLQELYPPFPIASEVYAAENTHYWAHGFSTLMVGELRILILNSSRNHLNEVIAKRGSVDLAVIEDIIARLGKEGSRKLNLLLTHHHPMKLGALNTNDESHMKHGEVLLERLLAADVGPWLVVHGHKHVPRIDYFGGSRTIPVFASGSLAARLWDEAASVAQNQFYLIDIEFDHKVPGLDDIVGTCNAWSWVPNDGWRVSGRAGGIMSGSGFGWRARVDECAGALEAALEASGRKWLKREELLEIEPRYEFLSTTEQLSVHRELREQDWVVVDSDGRLLELGRRA